MDMPTLMGTAVLVFILALLCLILIYARLPWFVKAALIALSIGAAYGFYSFNISQKGYAVAMQPKDGQRVIWIEVNEPGAFSSGAIYLWLYDENRPRVLQIPYSQATHKQINSIKQRIATGEAVYIGAGEGDHNDQNGGGNPDGGRGEGGGVGEGVAEGGIKFTVRTADLPAKN